MNWLGLDIGGANLKVADGRGYAASMPFPLWREPTGLSAALAQLIAEAPPAERLAVTMTGELADCFATKADGARRIVRAVGDAAGGRAFTIYLVDGRFVDAVAACEAPLLAAASNWHALAAFAARFAKGRPALLVDIGSTTSDLIPIVAGRVNSSGQTDPARLATGELVYTGVRRTPICALVERLPWHGQTCHVAAELFATTADAWLLLEQLPEEHDRCDTADGRPFTREAAHDRLARMICADRALFSRDDARRAAETVAAAQQRLLVGALRQVLDRQSQHPERVLLSGEGEFLVRRVVAEVLPATPIVSLGEHLGPDVSRAAPAHAVAVLASELRP
ncbi:MAG: H4MPT-linked C1 transfer pathway protein [Planctomycetes bacterium]|nr:H4MPT-linked C1 transfer pathway protein [Planctomycetota bacterium]